MPRGWGASVFLKDGARCFRWSLRSPAPALGFGFGPRFRLLKISPPEASGTDRPP